MEAAHHDYRLLLRHGFVTGAWDAFPGERLHEAWVRPLAELARADGLEIDHWAYLEISYANGIAVLRRPDGTSFPNPLEQRVGRESEWWLANVEAELGETLATARRRAGLATPGSERDRAAG